MSCSALLEAVRSGSVRPLRGSYVLELARGGQPLHPNRTLPETAFWTAEQLEGLQASLINIFGEEEAELRFAAIFIAVSWRWRSPEHPDADGKQLAVLAAATQAYLARGARDDSAGGFAQWVPPSSWRETNVRSRVFEPLKLAGSSVDCALLLDYASLPQPSTPNGQRRASLPSEAQEAMSAWLSHPGICMWMVTDDFSAGTGSAADGAAPSGAPSASAEPSASPAAISEAGEDGGWYDMGGWAYVERAIAALSKPSEGRLDLTHRAAIATSPMASGGAAPSAAPSGAPPQMSNRGGSSQLSNRGGSSQLSNRGGSPALSSRRRPASGVAERNTIPYGAMAAACLAPRGPLLAPAALAKVLAGSDGGVAKEFAGGSEERDMASRVYAEAFAAAAPRMTTLDLHGQRWNGAAVDAMSTALGSCSQLERLDISGGTVSVDTGAALSRALVAVPTLRTLIASGNVLGAGGARVLASEGLPSAKSLTALYMDGCGLRDAALELLLNSLRSLEGSGLTSLSLRDNALAPDGCVSLAAFVSNAPPSLATLDVCSNMLTADGDEEGPVVDLITQGLRPSSTLVTLALGGNALGDEAAAAVVRALPSCSPSLQSLDVRSDSYSPGMATQLAHAALSRHPHLQSFGGVPISAIDAGTLTTVDLAGCALGPAEASALGQLALRSSPLAYCNVDGNELLSVAELRGAAAGGEVCEQCDLSSAGLGTASAVFVASLLPSNTALTVLSLAHNRLGARAATALAEALPLQSSLTHIDLTGNQLGLSGARALAEALLAAPTSALTTLSLEGAPLPVRQLRGSDATRALKLDRRGLGPISAVVIAGLLKANGTLTALSLIDNAVGSDGASAIVQSLKGTKCATLDLTSNEIGKEGAKAIGEHLAALSAHANLTSLNLDGFALPIKKLRGADDTTTKPVDMIDLHKKRLGPLSGLVIAALVRSNAALTNLNLSGNTLGVVGASALAEATAHNTGLQSVDLRHNRLDADAKATVRAVAPLAVSGRLLVSTPDSDLGDDPAAKGAKGRVSKEIAGLSRGAGMPPAKLGGNARAAAAGLAGTGALKVAGSARTPEALVAAASKMGKSIPRGVKR